MGLSQSDFFYGGGEDKVITITIKKYLEVFFGFKNNLYGRFLQMATYACCKHLKYTQGLKDGV